MKQPLNKALKEYYSGELSESQLQNLQETGNSRFKLRIQWALSGGLGFVFASMLFSFIFNINQEPLALRIAKEVSYSHNKQIPSEILNDDYTLVGKSLNRLDFAIKVSSRIGEKYALVGGRYCSIQGQIAAQLKLQPENNTADLTLFQFKVPDSFQLSEDIHTEQVDGVEVKIWKEGAIGFALAKTVQ
ncbi:MAG: hypothetical protein AB8G05_23440 [Oligoflexales bacterium]